MTATPRPPDVSIIVPCYNEEAILAYTLQRLHAAFDKAGYAVELVAVDNGSHDRTGEIIRELGTRLPGIVGHRVEVNQGYGFGVLSGIPRCTAPWIGMIPADGQVDAEDVVRLYEAVLASDGNVLAKVRRRFRMDGLYRKLVSTSYNVLVRVLFPTLQSIDINGTPKLLPADVLRAMDLQSKGWVLDPEIMIKAHYMGLRVVELNVFSRLRGNGVSHIRVETCWEFLRHVLTFRFSPTWKAQYRQLAARRMSRPGSASVGKPMPTGPQS